VKGVELMNSSYAVRLEDIKQLPPLTKHSRPDKSRDSYFQNLTNITNRIRAEVIPDWDELSEEEREALKSLAYALLCPSNNNRVKSNSLKHWLRRWLTHLRLIVAILTGQFDSVIEAHIAAFKLAHAIMEAVENEESESTALFLDLLTEDAKNNPSKLVPFTKEMDKKLEQLLDGVELD